MKKQKHLKRGISFTMLTITGIGTIFGAGIYVLIGKAAGLAGNMVWLSFLIAAVISAFTGLSYAELSSLYPHASAEYIYTKKAFKKNIVAFVVSILVVLALIFGTTSVSFGFAGYFNSFFGITTPYNITVIILIAVLFVLISIKIKETVMIGVIFTVIEALGLLLIIICGIPNFHKINFFDTPELGFSGIMGATILIFFAYLGFEDMVKLSEETKSPKKTMPLALITAIGISTIFYILVSLSAISIIDPKTLAASPSPIADIGASVLGHYGYIILSIIALFATANTALFMLLAASRLIYGLAEDNVIPKIFAKINSKMQTPIIASFTAALIALLGVSLAKIEIAATITDLLVFIVFTVINLSVIVLRYKEKETPRGFKIPINIGKFPIIALLGVGANLFMITQFDIFSLLIAGIIIFVSFIAYFIFNSKQKN
jgi:basic amino acid/polyamine antiporter, APA family